MRSVASGNGLGVFDRCVLERFAGIICVCVETLHDVCRSDSDSNIQIE